MDKFRTEIGKYLGSTVLRTLNAGHDQLIKQLNKGYTKLQLKEQDEVNKKEREATGEDATVIENVLVVGVDNCNSVTKKKCFTSGGFIWKN